MEIKNVAVIGAGAMGSGIAQIAAQKGFEVIVYDISTPMLTKSKAGIEKNLEKLISKNKISESDRDAILARMTFTQAIEAVKVSDLVIEAGG